MIIVMLLVVVFGVYGLISFIRPYSREEEFLVLCHALEKHGCLKSNMILILLAKQYKEGRTLPVKKLDSMPQFWCADWCAN